MQFGAWQRNSLQAPTHPETSLWNFCNCFVHNSHLTVPKQTESELVNSTIIENTQERDTQTVCHIATNRDCIVCPWTMGLVYLGDRGWVVTMEQWWNDTDRGNWSAGRKTLYSVGGRWMNVYGTMVEWYWRRKTEVLGEKHYTVCVVDGWMSMEQWWNDTDRGKLTYWEKNIIQREW